MKSIPLGHVNTLEIVPEERHIASVIGDVGSMSGLREKRTRLKGAHRLVLCRSLTCPAPLSLLP